MRILITGSRAPVALELSRRFRQLGHTVFHADSLRNALAKWSRSTEKSFLVPRPIDHPSAYVASIAKIVDDHSIDWLIPTCEEIFYIAAHRSLLACDVLADDFEKLAIIHNKWRFSQAACSRDVRPPETRVWECHGHTFLSEAVLVDEEPSDHVFKPVYSRFASRTLIGPGMADLQKVSIAADESWVVQRRVYGTEYSTYSVAHQGRLCAHATYTSRYRAGRGSGIYFDAVRSEAIREFVTDFVASENYTGQIGFDFIQDEAGTVWVLEANPRATSGAHLFAIGDPLVDALTGRVDHCIQPSTDQPAMVEFAMPFWGLYDAFRKRSLASFIPHVRSARCTTWSCQDVAPTFALVPALAELVYIAMRERCSLQQASTFDIEWNGEGM